MKPFSERSPLVIGAIGLGLTAAIVLVALEYDKLPFINQSKEYSAYFAEAGGLTTGAGVQVSGFKVGQVSVDRAGRAAGAWSRSPSTTTSRLGDRTEAAIKTRGLLGTKILEVMPRGDGQPGGHDSARSHDVALPAAGRSRRPRDDDQRPEHQPAVRLVEGGGGDVLRDPAGTAGRGRGCGPVLGHPQRTRCGIA